MKPLASVWIVFAVGAVAIAAPLEMGLGAGPSFTSLDSLNHSIGVLNNLIEHLNGVVSVHPDVTGTVRLMESMGTGLLMSAQESVWLTDRLSLGAHLEYASSSSDTRGVYQGVDVSVIDVAYRAQVVGIVLGGGLRLVDVGIRLGASAGLGYFHMIVDRSVVFEIPEEYPEDIAGVPPEGQDRYRGGGLGVEASLNVSYPVVSWLAIGAQVRYRSGTVGQLRGSEGALLDLAGDGQADSISLHGLAVQFLLSFNINLSVDGGKETLQ